MILGIDYGSSRTGFAISENGFLAGTLETFAEKNMNKVAEHAAELALKHNVDTIIVGLPKNMDGSEGFRAEAVRAFVAILKEYTELPIILEDERMTTMVAHQYLNLTGTGGQKRKKVVDTLSAEIILQNYLDQRRRKV